MKRSFVQINGELVPKDEVQEREVRVDSGALWGDRSYRGLKASDGTPIDTRTKHREYMKKNNLSTMDDYTQTWAKADSKRQDHLRGIDPTRRADIVKALERRRG